VTVRELPRACTDVAGGRTDETGGPTDTGVTASMRATRVRSVIGERGRHAAPGARPAQGSLMPDLQPRCRTRRTRRTILVSLLVALLATTLAAPGSASPPPQAQDDRALTVMTRNLYLGTELGPVFAADGLEELQAALVGRWQEMIANDFPSRAHALAAEIATHRPHLVGLQEASLWRSGALGQPATDVEFDFTAILLDALAAAGTPYRVATTVELFDSPSLPVLALGRSIRLTDRQAILVRADAARDGLVVRRADAGVFRTALPLTIPAVGAELTVTRGWTSVDVKLRGQDVRVVNTHLEAFGPPELPGIVRTLQAQELLAPGGPLDTDLPVVLVGDVNSPAPGAGTPAAGDLAYPLLLTQGGFTDVWSALRPTETGLTCCYPSDLRVPDPTLRSRIDVVFAQPPLQPRSVETVGDAMVDGRWPSDHLGVVATLEIPPPGRAGGRR
jgi:endonuclease/exonuclease/phosphatase family metal-dependent hydrolase